MNLAGKLTEIQQMLPALAAEGILALTILLLTVLVVIRNIPWYVPQMVAGAGILTSMYLVSVFQPAATGSWITSGDSSIFWRLLFDGSVLIIFLFNMGRDLQRKAGEYVILTLSLLLGAHLLVMANHMLLVFMSVELMSFSAYLLTTLSLGKRNIASGFKYFVFGAVSTALMLYGMSLYYGMTHTLYLTDTYPAGTFFSASGILALLLITFGLLFKIAAVPFHIWVPDVYRCIPYPVLALFSTVPKLAALGFLVNWASMIQGGMEFIAGIGLLTIIAGNFGALRQTNLKRLMGFSAIAQTGFMLIGLMFDGGMLSYLYFYAAAYVIMSLGIFHLLNYFELKRGAESLEDLNGLATDSVFRTISMVVFVIALTGLPPTVGFTAKLFLFSGLSAVYLGTGTTFLLVLLVLAVLNAVVSLAYYLKLPYHMIFKRNPAGPVQSKKSFLKENFLATLLVLGVLILFFKPEWLMGWINSVNFVP